MFRTRLIMGYGNSLLDEYLIETCLVGLESVEILALSLEEREKKTLGTFLQAVSQYFSIIDQF